MNKDSYKKTEKWWLSLVIIFYLLYNLPGVPKYGDSVSAIWHGILTIVPLWIITYIGLFKLLRQRKLKIPVSQTKGQKIYKSKGDDN